MCRTTPFYRNDGVLRLKSISLRLSLSSAATATATANAVTVSLLPEFLTLVFLPRISGSFLEINGSKFRPDSPAYLTLHRVLSSDFVFTTNDRVRACDGVFFEVHIADNRLLRGVFRQCDDGGLRMECKCVREREFGVSEVEVVVTAKNGRITTEKVVAKKRRQRHRKFQVALPDIPEERDSDVVEKDEEEGSHVCSCCCSDEGEARSDGGDDVDLDQMVDMEMEMEMEMERVRWAVDVGIWAVCLGVGLLVSTASFKNRRRRKFLV